MLNPAVLEMSPALKDNTGLLMTVVTIAGILIVFFALILLIVLISAFGKITGATGKKKEKAIPMAEPSKAAIPAPVVEEGISDEIIAVIAAAVASLEGSGNFAVRSVRRAPVQKARSAWNAAGVMEQSRTF